MWEKNDREIAKNKLLILYILKISGSMFTRDSFVNFILKNNYFNYFLTVQYLYELEDAGLISSSRENIFITEDGLESLEIFKDRLELSIAEDIEKNLTTFDWNIPPVKNFEGKYSIDRFDEDVNLNLMLFENEKMVFNLNIVLEDMEKAVEFGESWLIEPQKKVEELLKVLGGKLL